MVQELPDTYRNGGEHNKPNEAKDKPLGGLNMMGRGGLEDMSQEKQVNKMLANWMNKIEKGTELELPDAFRDPSHKMIEELLEKAENHLKNKNK